MDLTLTDVQAMLAETASAFVEREVPAARVRAAADLDDGFDAELWSALTSLGWSGLLIAEELGGAGQGLVEMAVLAEALGRGPVPSPLLTSAVGAGLLIDRAGTEAQRHRWLPALATGEAVGTVAAFEPGGGDPALPGGDELSGTRLLVPWAAAADVVVVATADGLYLVDPADGRVRVTRHDDLGIEPLFAVELRAAPAEPLGSGDADEHAALLAAARDRMAVVGLAYALGAGERALDLTLSHARERHQFGRPIGAFQAVAHRCVDMRTDLDACRALAHRAAWALDRGGDAELAVASALAYATDALRAVFVHAHQVHGAVGFSTEHDLHLSSRVAKRFELDHGGAGAHLLRVASAMGLG